jgi:hypothetical protein
MYATSLSRLYCCCIYSPLLQARSYSGAAAEIGGRMKQGKSQSAIYYACSNQVALGR